MATFEQLLAISQGADQTRLTGTRSQPKRPAVISNKDIFGPVTAPNTSMQSFGPGAQQKQQGGWAGFIGDVLESPLGKVITKGGELISYPGRLVTSTVQEIADQLDSDPNTNASWDDLFKQASDPSFGFGRVIGDLLPKNNWFGRAGNRIIGFAGDVILDPTTYLTLGAGKAVTEGVEIAGKAGAQALAEAGAKRAARAVEKSGKRGLSLASQEGRLAFANRLAEIGADPAVVVNAGRMGRAAVKDADLLAKAGYSRAGIYWMGKRVPMTTKLGTIAENSLTRARVWSGDHLFKRLSSVFTPRDMQMYRVQIARGILPKTEEGVDILKLVVSRNAERAEQGTASRLAKIARNQLIRDISDGEIEAVRGSAYKYLDTAAKAAPGSTAEKVANSVRTFLDTLGNDAVTTAKKMDPEAPFAMRENYFPHIPGEKAMEWLSNDGSTLALTVRDQVFNPFDNTSAWKTRMSVGDDFFGKILTEEDVAAGIDGLNKIGREYGGLDFDFFETDLPTILEKYTDMYAKQKGILARKQSMIDSGVYKKLDEIIEINPDIERHFSDTITRTAKARSAARNKAIKDLNEFTKFAESFVSGNLDIAERQLSEVAGKVTSALSDVAGAGIIKAQAERALVAAREALQQKQYALANLGTEGNPIIYAMEERYNATISRIADIEEEIARTGTVTTEIMERIQAIAPEVESFDKYEQTLMQRGNLITEQWYSIVAGENPTRNATLAENIRKSLFGEPKIEGGMQKRVSGERPIMQDKELLRQVTEDFRRENKIPKKRRLTPAQYQAIRDKYELAGGKFEEGSVGVQNQKWFIDAQGAAPIDKKDIVKAIDPDSIQNVLNRSIAGEASLKEMRATAMALLIGRDDIQQELRARLERMLVEAAKADSFYAALRKLERTNKGNISLRNLLTNFGNVEAAITDDILSYTSAKRFLANLDPDMNPNQWISPELLANIINSPEYDGLSTILGKYAATGDDFLDYQKLAGMTSGLEYEDVGGMAVRRRDWKEVGVVDEGFKPVMNDLGQAGGLSYGDLINILTKHVSDVPGKQHEYFAAVQSVMTGQLKNVTNRLEDNAVVYMDNIIRSLEYELGNIPSPDEVANYIDRVLNGKIEKSSIRTRTLTGRSAYDPSNEAESIRAVMNDIRKKLRSQEEVVLNDYFGQADVRAMQREVRAGTATKSSLEAVKAEATEKFILTGNESIEQIRQQMADTLTDIYFRSEVKFRFDRVVDHMAKEGYVANEGMFRAVVNAVARNSAQQVQLEQRALTRVQSTMSNVVELIESQDWVGREGKLYERINAIISDDTFDSSRSTQMISRLNGHASAGEILEEYKLYGGARGDSGYVRKRRLLTARLKEPMLTDAERIQLQKELDAIPSKEKIAAKKKSLKKGKILDWWKANIDPIATSLNDQQIASTLGEYSKIRTGSGRLAPDASVTEMKRWAEQTSTKAGKAGRELRNRTGWLVDASDPYVDVRKLTYTGSSVQDLPGMYAESLVYGAERLENANKVFRELLADAAAKDLSIDEFIYSIKYGEHSGDVEVWNYRQMVLNEALKAPKGAKIDYLIDVMGKQEIKEVQALRDIHYKIEEMKNTPEYLRALVRQDEQNVIATLLPYSMDGQTTLMHQRPRHLVARDQFNSGEIVYARKGDANYGIYRQKSLANIEQAKARTKADKARSKVNTADPDVSEDILREWAMKADEAEAQAAIKYEIYKRIEQMANADVPLDGSDFTLVKNAAEFQEGYTYYSVRADSIAQATDISKRMKEAAKAGNIQEAEALRRIREGILIPILEADPVPLTVKTATGESIEVSFQPWEIEMLFNFHGDTKLLEENFWTSVQKLREGKEQFGRFTAEQVRDYAEFMRKYAPESRSWDYSGNAKLEDEVRSTALRIARSQGMSREDGTKYADSVVEQSRIKYANAREIMLSDMAAKKASKKNVVEGLQVQAERSATVLAGATATRAERDAALQKIHWIAEAIGRGELTAEDISNSVQLTARINSDSVYPVTENFRRWRQNYIDDIWKFSQEKRYLDDVAELGASAEAKAYRIAVRDTNKVVSSVMEMRAEARRAWGDVHAPLPNAPYGYKPFDLPAYNKFYKNELDRLIKSGVSGGEAEVQARAFARDAAYKVPYEKPVVGVAGAQHTVDKLNDEVIKNLEAITRTTNGEYDAMARYSSLRGEGKSIAEAVDVISSEVLRRHPDGETLVTASALSDIAFRRSALAAENGFLRSILEGETFNLFGVTLTKGDVLNSVHSTLIEDAKKLAKELKLLRGEDLKAMRKLQTPLIKDATDAEKVLLGAEDTLLKAAQKFDAAKTIMLDAQSHAKSVIPGLKDKVDALRSILERLQRAKGAMNIDDIAKRQDLQEWMDESEDLLREIGIVNIPERANMPAIDLNNVAASYTENMATIQKFQKHGQPTKDYEKFLKLKANYLNAVSEFTFRDREAAVAEAMMLNLKDGYWGKQVVKQLNEGLVSLEKIGLPSYQASRELEEASRNMAQMLDPAFVRSINRVIGKYTAFFKSYATSTPGFVVRNAMQNTFMVTAAGADPRNMLRGLELYRQFSRAVEEGTHEAWLLGLKEGEREQVALAIKAMDASGYGRTTDAFTMWKPKRKGVIDNKYTRVFRTRNEAVEGSARFMLAYDSVIKGADLNQATARVKRYLFDYTDIGTGDSVMRTFVPFWFWMSRNLPLQIVNQWTNPRAYNIYNHAMHAIGMDDSEDRFLPSWMREQGAVKVGDNLYVMMDMGFNRVGQQFEELKDPARLLSYANPIMRLPFETIFGDRKFYRNTQFKDKDQQTIGGPLSPAVQLLAEMLFQGRDLPSGERGSSERFNYAAQNLIPILGQVERIMPSTEDNEKRQVSNILGYLGIPLRQVTEDQRDAERRRQAGARR